MIWTENSLKCFHEDGTVFETIIEEDVSATVGKDEFGNNFLAEPKTSINLTLFRISNFTKFFS